MTREKCYYNNDYNNLKEAIYLGVMYITLAIIYFVNNWFFWLIIKVLYTGGAVALMGLGLYGLYLKKKGKL